MVTSSIDNTLKVWDVTGVSGCLGTLSGHTNHKHFVGLTVGPGGCAPQARPRGSLDAAGLLTAGCMSARRVRPTA